MGNAPSILVLGGSTRPNRRSTRIAEWVASIGRAETSLTYEAVDLRSLYLTMGDETGIPARDGYALPTTRAWSERVADAAGVILVSPQYNWGYPAPLKNAIDHLYREWADKPVLIVTYGGHGGGKCAAQLREVLTGLHTRLTETMPALVLPRARIEANDGAVDPEADFVEQKADVLRGLKELAAICVTAS